MLHRVAGYAVEIGLLPADPITGRRVGTARTTEGVDPRVVVNPAQARQLLAAVTYVGAAYRPDRGCRLRGFFACLYYAGLRPGEAQQLRDTDAKLPTAGWGELVLSGSLTGVSGEHSTTACAIPTPARSSAGDARTSAASRSRRPSS